MYFYKNLHGARLLEPVCLLSCGPLYRLRPLMVLKKGKGCYEKEKGASFLAFTLRKKVFPMK